MSEAVVLPFPQVSNSSSRSNNTVPGASEAHTTFSPVETELLPQKTKLSSTSLVDPHIPSHTLCLPTFASPFKSTSVEENSQSHSGSKNGSLQPLFSQNAQQNTMFSQLQIPVLYVEDGSNLPPKHPPTIHSLNIQYFPPLPNRQKTVAVGLSAHKAALPANLQRTTKSDSRKKKVSFMPNVSVQSSPPTIPIISTFDPPTNHANTNLDHSPSKFVYVSHNSSSNPVQSSDPAEHTNASETNSNKAILPSSNSSFTQHSPSPCLNRSLTNQYVTLSNSVDNDWDGKPLPQFRHTL
ncbi:hypothetical protein LguiA_031322 [Lonicera macranthoides]